MTTLGCYNYLPAHLGTTPGMSTMKSGDSPTRYEISSWSSRTGRNTNANFKSMTLNYNPTTADEDYFLPAIANVESCDSRVELHLTIGYSRVDKV